MQGCTLLARALVPEAQSMLTLGWWRLEVVALSTCDQHLGSGLVTSGPWTLTHTTPHRDK